MAITYKAYRGKYYEDKAIRATIRAYFFVPKSYSKQKRQLIARFLHLPRVKPDSDNIAKIILDGLNGIAYKDDSQVTTLIVRKRYTFDERNEGVLVEIKEDTSDK